MGSNSSKNLSFSQTLTTDAVNTNDEFPITPIKDGEFVDPRSPTIQHRTPVSSPGPVRSWRAIAELRNKDEDPRSPSLQRTPAHKRLLKLSEPFDPRSPSINRTPLNDLGNSEEVVSSPYVAGRAISMSSDVEPIPALEPQEEKPNEEPAEEHNHTFADSAELAGDSKRQDGASLCTSDASVQLYNSENLQNDFQKTAMQSVEIVRVEGEEPSTIPEVKKDVLRKRKKSHKKRDSYASSPLKKSYSPIMSSGRENYSTPTHKQLCSTPPRSPLSTLSTGNRHGSPIDKSKLNMNLFSENMPPSIAL